MRITAVSSRNSYEIQKLRIWEAGNDPPPPPPIPLKQTPPEFLTPKKTGPPRSDCSRNSRGQLGVVVRKLFA